MILQGFHWLVLRSRLDLRHDLRLLCLVGYGRFIGSDKPGSHPDCVGAENERGGNATAVKHAAGGDDLHWLLGERRLVLLTYVGAGRDENAFAVSG